MLNVKLNFKVGQIDLNCRHGCNVPENQRHILDCTAIADNCVANPVAPQYSDIFGVEVDKISTVGRMLMTRSKSFFQDNKPSAQETQKTGDTGATAANMLLTVVLD